MDGNVSISLPPSAIQGLQVSVLGPGNVKFTVGKDFIANILKAITLTSASIDMKALTSIKATAPLFEAKAANVNLGIKATQSAVLGELLLEWLLTHTHGTGVGPSGPPIVIPTPTLLSKSVKITV